MQPYDPEGDGPYSSGTAFLLWLPCLLGACGIHRFYLGKPWSGLLYLLTFGLLGIGQLIDLFKLHDLVLLQNTKARLLGYPAERRRLPRRARRRLSRREHKQLPPHHERDPLEELRMQLVQAAAAHQGSLSVSQGVMATGRTFPEVEAMLDEMAQSGYVGIDNDPQTGAVIYTFGQLG